jgi:hypothetical protein
MGGRDLGEKQQWNTFAREISGLAESRCLHDGSSAGTGRESLKRKLFAHLVLIPVHDSIRRHTVIPENPADPALQIGLALMSTFTVMEFLMALYPEDPHKLILKIDTRIVLANMNFTQFASTRANLSLGQPKAKYLIRTIDSGRPLCFTRVGERRSGSGSRG